MPENTICFLPNLMHTHIIGIQKHLLITGKLDYDRTKQEQL